MDTTMKIADATLAGWRQKAAERVAPPIARRTEMDVEQVRAAVGVVFFVLAALYVMRSLRRLAS